MTEPKYPIPAVEVFLARYERIGATVREGWLYAIIRSPRGRWAVLYTRPGLRDDPFCDQHLAELQEEVSIIGHAKSELKAAFKRHSFPELELLVFRFHRRSEMLEFEERVAAALRPTVDRSDFRMRVQNRLCTLIRAREAAEAKATEAEAARTRVNPLASEFFDFGDRSGENAA